MNKKFYNKTVVAWGDSLTDDGIYSGNILTILHPSTSTYTNLLELNTGMRVFNRGVCGATTATALARAADVVNTGATYGIIMIGGNDIYSRTSSYSLTTVINNIDSMVTALKEAKIIPIVATEAIGWYHADQKTEETTLIEELRQGVIQYTTQNNVLCADLCTTAIYTDASYRPIDNVHPLQAGHAIMARYFINFFDNLIPDIITPVTPMPYGTITTDINYQWGGGEEILRKVYNVLDSTLVQRSYAPLPINYTYTGRPGVLYDSVTSSLSETLSQKNAAGKNMNYVWSGTGGAARVTEWAVEGIENVNGMLTLLPDNCEAELDEINGEVI